ncbi:LacI family DNA-binding transcriptional regulator [Arthrobacter alpinus]|uniref:LacI family DNA-binding transcriptional regulator n=1 Tax=Arthrobacter alpinus TaxID=656366 RepID=UPI001B8D7DC2|nr:substrate-binding domain-containing protein [Arthrobacter alpinus]
MAAVNAFISYRTDAIILAASRLITEDPRLTKALTQYINNGGRVVTLGPSAIPEARVVTIANHDGAAELVGTLLGQGVRRFVVLAGPHERNTARVRVEGFLERLHQEGLEPVAVVHGSFNSQGGFDSTMEFLNSLNSPDAQTAASLTSDGDSPLCFLAANDVMALGAMTALRSRGLRIPEDAQVAGFDDIPTLRDHFPGLTTYRLPLEEIGLMAAQLALAPSAKQASGVTGSVVLRESAGNPGTLPR